jgi:hypothetical protein
MTPEQLEFHNIFLNRGGLFDANLFGEFSKFFEYSKIEFYHIVKTIQSVNPLLPSVNIDFINNDGFNAVATKVGEKYYIGINWGSSLLLYDLFQRLMSNPSVFSNIGDNSKDEVKKIYNPHITNFSTLMLASDTNEKAGPKDLERQAHASLLTSLAIRFLFLHEYGHIVNGHVDLKGNLFNSFSISEIEKASLMFSPLNSQTIEMDADRFAATFSIWFLDMSNHRDFYGDIAAAQKACRTYFEMNLENLFFSIYSLFRIFTYKQYSLEELQKKSHPIEVIRQRIFFLVSDSILNKRFGDKINEMMARTIYNVENAFSQISETKIDINPIKEAYDKEQSQYLNLIIENWNNVRPQLTPYAYNELSPLQTR